MSYRPYILFCRLPPDSPSSRLPLIHFEPAFHHGPIDVGEEGLDVLRAFGRFEVEEVGMLPNIHNENWLKTGDVASLMQSDPVV